MARSIEINVFDPDSVDALVRSFSDIEANIRLATDDSIGQWAASVAEYAGSEDSPVHVGPASEQWSNDRHEPGRLRRSASLVRYGSGEYGIMFDAQSNEGYPYASVEFSRGGDHDPTSALREYSDAYWASMSLGDRLKDSVLAVFDGFRNFFRR